MLLEFRLALLTLAVGLVYIPGLPSGASAPRWWVLALGLVVVLWKQPLNGNFPGLRLVLLFVTWCALGLFWTATPWDTLEGIFAVVLLGTVFLLATQTKNLYWCWEMAAFVCWFQVPVLLLQLFSDIKFNALGVSGLFFSKNMLSEFALAAGVGVLFTQNRWLVVGPVLCLLLPTLHDPAWEVVLGGGLALVVFAACQKFERPFLLAGCGIALVLVLGALGVYLKPDSFAERLEIWQATLYSAYSYPYGWGLNSFADAAPNWEFVHNDFLQVFFELGVPGIILAGFVFWRSFSAPGGLAEKCVLAALLGCAMLWWPFRTPATALLAALALGHLYGCSARARELRRYCRVYGSHGIQFNYQDFSPDTVRAARAGCEVLPVRPQYPLVGREVSEHF